MKKTFALFTLCLVLILGIVAVAAFTLHHDRDQVSVTAETLAGDPAAAQGLVAEQTFHYNYKLYWDVTIPLADPAAASTVFTRDDSLPPDSVPDDSLSLYFPAAGFGIDSLESWPDLMELFLDVAARTPDGDTRLELVHPGDYMEYYPLTGDISFYNAAGEGTSLDLTPMLKAFFRLPVLERDRWLIQITKDDRGVPGYLFFHTMADAVQLSTCSALADSYALFTFGETSEPIFPDFSQVPGGFGLYRVDFAPGQDGVPVLVPDSLRNVYPLPQDTWVAGLTLSPDQKEVYLLTIQGDETLCTVLDGETMAAKQTFPVPLPPPETTVTAKGTENIDLGAWEHRVSPLVKFSCGENFLCFQEDKTFHLFTRQADGTLGFQFTGTLTQHMQGRESYRNSHALVWNGEKLAAASQSLDGLCLSVFDPDGALLYEGRYVTSLAQVHDSGASFLVETPLALAWE